MNTSSPPHPLRLWPGILAVAIQWLCYIVLPGYVSDFALYCILGGAVGGTLIILLWWLFFSRAPWSERLGALALMILGLPLTRFLVHPSLSNAGMGYYFYLSALPVLCLALVCWAILSQFLGTTTRRIALVAAIGLALGSFTLLRTGGVTGGGSSDFHWRWTPTPEERLLALGGNTPTTPTAIPSSAKTNIEWPGFRGPARNSILPGVQLATDWAKSPPVKLWHRPIGPGWSSFAVQGDLLYTQEQRGNDEIVACYSVSTGQPIWTHRDEARFWESNAGAGPRATPTLHDGRIYTLGATGIANALNATDGKVLWTRKAADDTGAKIPEWAFAGSPLMFEDLVIFSTGGRLVAYDRSTGNPRWTAKSGGGGYSSPQLVTLGGMKQLLLLNASGIYGADPTSGKELWKYVWPGDGIVQPAFTAEGDLLLGSGSGVSTNSGLHRITVTSGPDGWNITPRWTSKGLRPHFNDIVVHQGHAYGFDAGILACINLADGQRKWKGGRFGHGQLLLVSDQHLLLVLSEKGEIALVKALPDKFDQLARLPAIEGKTWNHPVLVGDILLVRNDQEMAAFRLAK